MRRAGGILCKRLAAAAAVAAIVIVQDSASAQSANRRVLFPTEAQFEASSQAQGLVRTARALVGDDLQREFANVCTHTGPQRAALARQQAGLPPIENYVVEPTKIFDDMWYLGPTSQGAFVITTSDGLILIDTLNNTEEARDILVPSMERAGLDPQQIKYIVLTHGHPGQTDHTGGANYLQRTYAARVAMGKPDWDATLPAQSPERPLAERDIDLVDGSTLTLGDTTLRFAISPGHSVGTLAIFIPVTWHGEAAIVMLHGGALQTPGRADFEALERIVSNIAKPDGVRGLLNTHPGIYQDTLTDMATIRNNPQGPNPLLYGEDQAQRYWSMIVECARARVIALEEAVGG
ncbi:MAG: MBL fold metallo-hydrolase [Gammaproteobacteria bacterium]|nr:MBL fold metallo-hydrolase [Gammaproteobacteria bacterium]